MNSLKLGGFTALIEALLYVIGMVILAFVLAPAMENAPSEVDKLQFILEHKSLFQIWNLLIYVLFGLLLVPLTIAINQPFGTDSLMASKVTPIFGFIWAGLVIASGMINNVGLDSVDTLFASNPEAALASWKTIATIQNGLGGGVEVVGYPLPSREGAKFTRSLSLRVKDF